MDKLQISDQSEDIDFEFVYRFLSEESIWATGIGRETQKRAIENSLCISAFLHGKQIGFVRVVTDYATFAWVDDLFVDPSIRGAGVAKRLIREVLEHPSLNTIASWWTCSSNPAARALFKQFAFDIPEKNRIAKWIGRPKIKTDGYRT